MALPFALASLAILLLQPIGTAAPTSTPLQGYTLSAAGLSQTLTELATFEPQTPVGPTQNRLVIIAGLDSPIPTSSPTTSTQSAEAFIKWWCSDAGQQQHPNWQIAVLPQALPDGPPSSITAFPPQKGFFNDPIAPGSRYIWRWCAMSSPDLVVDIRASANVALAANLPATALFPEASPANADELVGALGSGTPSGLPPVPAIRIEGPTEHLERSLREIVKRSFPSSALRKTLADRAARPPLSVAQILAKRYPGTPSMSYIPALAWSGAIQVSKITGDPSYREKALAHMAPFRDGSKAALPEKANLPSIAGHLAFSDLARLESAPDAAALARKAADHLVKPTNPSDLLPSASRWTDDMFMATSVLSRVAAATSDPVLTEATVRILESYSTRLQRPDGIFVHVESSPFAWGRGNGFAAFGLMDALTHLPADAKGRDNLLQFFKKHMAGLIKHQSPDGAWRQVIDEPGAYREFTATAMITTAMARGIRRGWIDHNTFRPIVERGWHAVSLRVADDASLIDVCTGTGAKKDCDRSHYLHREAISGFDDRGGAMGLTAALEMHALHQEFGTTGPTRAQKD